MLVDLNDPDQYQTPDNLAARIRLHVLYSTASEEFPTWLRRLVAPTEDSTVLDVGCGRGDIWFSQDNGAPQPRRIVLADRSAGMINAAVAATGLSGVVADAVSLPFASASFDTVLAAHMLYHVDNPAAGIREVARVMASDGRFIASTNGSSHMRELDALTHQPPVQLSFSLDNGESQLRSVFESVVAHRREDELRITDTDDAIDYLDSYRRLSNDDRTRIRATIDGVVAAHGFFSVTKEMGAFVCTGGLVQ